MIQLQDIRRQFGPQVLFDGLTWKIHPGARLGLVGPNGAGKTTLLRILDRRDEPDRGTVHRAVGMQVGYLPQEVETIEEGSVLAVALSGSTEIAGLERELEQVERELAQLAPGDGRERKLTQRYGELRQRFEQLEGDRLEARARVVLAGLGIAAESFHEPLGTLSGGWRMRVALTRLLLASPELLLLDEPTNHLDLEAIDWLEGFLDAYEGAFVVVSHDRYFLNRMVDSVVELERGRLTEYPGNYDHYLAEKQVRAEARAKAAKQQAREVAKTEQFIERFRYKNTKARQVQSRIRSLGKVERIEIEEAQKTVRFGFPPAPRSGDIVVRGQGLAKRFGETVVYDDMDVLLGRGDRVALVGPNGSGKSTLLKLLAGRLVPDAGTLELGHKVAVQYYGQHRLDDLDPERTVLEEMQQAAPATVRLQLRKLLGAFLFVGQDVDKNVGALSGGEKARLALAKLLVQPANLLLLDEPTNHLDLRSREVLEGALNEYGGTLVIVSHDRYFINRIATSIGEAVAGRFVLQPGDFDEYQEWKRRRAAEAAPAAAATATPVPGTGRREGRREAKRRQAEERNRLYRERKAVASRLAPLEARIDEAEGRLRELELRQADQAVYSDPDRATEVGREKAETEAALRGLYEAWEAAGAEKDADS